jgi:hypothetical protein
MNVLLNADISGLYLVQISGVCGSTQPQLSQLHMAAHCCQTLTQTAAQSSQLQTAKHIALAR